ncbi:OprD family outer membrane porin [Oceanobacter mangrovi]|uniref:OprD family outer membrane porin n=1 Tax=Oceanobacter mangrovi TaxID=2862510 RepID=UPI001C8D319D|nr:OprD family outer membrane porin [Oceanobacter mangrovi]
MKRRNLYTTGAVLTALTGLTVSNGAAAAFVEDTAVKMELKNYYLDRRYTKNDTTEGNWSQAIDLTVSSGYTDTKVQVALDINTTDAIVFDSEGNDGSLPLDEDGEAVDNYGRLGATLKLKYSNTLLSIGDYRPHLPVAWDDTSRVLDTIYEGAVIESKEVEGLDLKAGVFWKAVTRNSSDKEKFYVYKGQDENRSDGLYFAGASYNFSKAFSGTYYYGQLKDFYTQNTYALAYKDKFGSTGVSYDLRYLDYANDGKAYGGDDMDVDVLSTGLSLANGNHKLRLSYQSIDGERAVPTLNGYVPQPYTLHWSSAAFIMPDERSTGIRYGYDFKDVGAPGLSLFTQYIFGKGIDVAGGEHEHQSERDIYLTYAVQNETLKGLSFSARDMWIDRSWTSGFREFRFITTYTRQF